MELIKAEEQIFTKKDILFIKRNHHLIDMGSETTCYNMSSKQVIKFFDIRIVDPNSKLFLPDKIYGSNSFVFVDAIQKYCDKIISYTMKYVRGAKLGTADSVKLFYELSYNMLLEYITILLQDCKNIANNGIQVFDCFESNIILAPTGFRQIDCVDFTLKDKDPSLIEKENIRLMSQTIWDCLIAPHLSTFIINNNLRPEEFTRNPLEFIQELKRISQELSDTEVLTLKDTKCLSRKK